MHGKESKTEDQRTRVSGMKLTPSVREAVRRHPEAIREGAQVVYDRVAPELPGIGLDEWTDFVVEQVAHMVDPGYILSPACVYEQLEQALGVKVEPAPDEWDQRYNVDFFIEVNGKYIGLQIKPVTFDFAPEEYEWKQMQEATHKKFEQKFGGRVFTIYSVAVDKGKQIKNPEVVQAIKEEIGRLSR